MIKNLHHSFQPINILRSLKDQGFQALNVTPKLKWKTKEPLDMFIVSFHKDTDINKIYNIKTVCRAAVTVEPVKSNKYRSAKYVNRLAILKITVIRHQNVLNVLVHI